MLMLSYSKPKRKRYIEILEQSIHYAPALDDEFSDICARQ